jgi:glutamyl-tRNA(Gln) amidotransferase subunit E
MSSPIKLFHEMTDSDYKELGLRAGLEIHQQLKTVQKLFCRCPAGNYNDAYDAEILRHMRPTLSELGEYDGTALMEFKTKKEIIYQIKHETVCTYEMDDTPPFEINQQALDFALEIAMLLNYKLVSEIHIARKQYLDGSIPTGFQRTTIVGIDGWIPYKNRNIGLFQLGLEEDACREVSDIGHRRVYRTDRLGMPLIEMVTKPDMRSPHEVAEVANLLRWLVRSTGRVRTGIGGARQDVNVSIKGGTRIEIKGVPRIPLIPLLIYNEARRQYALLKIREELLRRGITEDSFKSSSSEVTHLLVNSIWDPIRRALKRGEEIHCVKLQGYAGILKFPTQSGKVFSGEISDRVRVIACLTRLPNILTSDNTEETIDSVIWARIQKLLKAKENDALILVWGKHEDVQTAVEEIIIRAREATVGVPSETRQAMIDGTNGFERILPGPDRMYPDTDLPPLEIPEKRIRQLDQHVPEPFWKRVIKYRKMDLPEHLIIPIASSPKAAFFERIIEDYKMEPKWVARYLFEATKAWKRKGSPIDKLEDKIWIAIFESAKTQPSVIEKGLFMIADYLDETKVDIYKELKVLTEKQVTTREIENTIKSVLNDGFPDFSDDQKRKKFLMGQIMKKYRGFIRGAEIENIVERVLRKKHE